MGDGSSEFLQKMVWSLLQDFHICEYFQNITPFSFFEAKIANICLEWGGGYVKWVKIYFNPFLPSSAKPKLEALASGLAEISFIFVLTDPPPPRKVPKLEIKLPKTIPNQTISIEDDLNGRRPQWKTTSMEEDLNGRQPQWKTTSMKDDFIWRQSQWKTTLMEDNHYGRQPW